MKPIAEADRRVVNIHETAFTRLESEDYPGTEYLQLDTSRPTFVGFYVYRMSPGSVTEPHEHPGSEEFLVLEGELIDHDGYVYRAGDLVWLAPGTKHNSRTETGCLLAVFGEKMERGVPADER